MNTQGFRTGILYALTAASLYGTVPVFVRGAFTSGIPSVESTFIRTMVIATVFIVAALIGGVALRIPRVAWRSFAGQTIATLVVSVSYLASVQFIPVGLAVIIFFSFPVFIVLLSSLVEGHRPDGLRILCVGTAFVGLAIAIGPSFENLDWRGLALAFAAALGAVVQSFTGRGLNRHVTPLVFGGLAHLVILPATLMLALWVGGGNLNLLTEGSVTGPGHYYLAGLSGAYLVAYFLHMKALRAAPASVVMPFFNLEPIISTGVAAVLFGEVLNFNQYAGGGLVLAALVLAGFTDRQKVVA